MPLYQGKIPYYINPISSRDLRYLKPLSPGHSEWTLMDLNSDNTIKLETLYLDFGNGEYVGQSVQKQCTM